MDAVTLAKQESSPGTTCEVVSSKAAVDGAGAIMLLKGLFDRMNATTISPCEELDRQLDQDRGAGH